MAYVIHNMKVLDYSTFDINVHFGAMGSGIASAIGLKLAKPERPVVSITGDGCFFMHGMEILTAKEYNLPILFVVMNNARLGNGISWTFVTIKLAPILIRTRASEYYCYGYGHEHSEF